MASNSCFTILLLVISFLISPVYAKDSKKAPLDKGNQAYLKQNYDQALTYYRQHLRANPKDADVWTLLAATYYHQSQPKRAIKLLRKHRKKASLKSQNWFYRGLSYDALGKTEKALKSLKRASKYDDPFGALSTFEMIAHYYEARNKEKTQELIDAFKKRFKEKSLTKIVTRIEDDLKNNRYFAVPESQRSQYRSNIYKQHPYSLTEFPHFWTVQLGYFYSRGTRTNPALSPGDIPSVEEGAGFEESALNARASFGIGPIQNRGATIYLGYVYEQAWLTTRDRISLYLKEPLDFSYFPFRPDLQERTHRLFVELKSQPFKNLKLGLYSDLEYIKAGSSLYPAPERPEIRRTLNVANTLKTVPWLQWIFAPNQYLEAHVLFEKTIDQEESAFSNKTYSFADSDDQFFSYGITYGAKLLGEKLDIEIDLFRYRYLFNDYWLEHYKTALMMQARWQLFRNWSLFGRFGTYQDDYILPEIKTNSCDLSSSIDGENRVSVNCKRVDTGILAQAGFSYSNRDESSWSAYLNYVKHENAELKVYNEDRLEILLLYSLAFPSVDTATPYSRRFEKAAIRVDTR